MHKFISLTVESAMTTNVRGITLETSLKEIGQIFEETGFHMLPVLEGKLLLGVVSEYDFLRAFIFSNLSPVPHYERLLDKTAAHIYNADPLTVSSAQPLSRVLQMIVESQARSFPVVNADQEILGIISRHDVVVRLMPEYQNLSLL
ncbi:MAG: CBS domain-containing protein [SAR324 cluster bacterium]|nr:CBS domain-containing protein [SAR324 cluster bacterium]